MRGIHWFRNDLRLRDNGPLDALADRVDEWLPVFVLDDDFLGEDLERPRVHFLLDSLARLRDALDARGVRLLVLAGRPEVLLPRLLEQTGASLLSFGAAATPLGRRRDERVRRAVERVGGEILSIHDHTVFGPEEIRTKTGGAYSVFTPFKKSWWDAWARAPRLAAARSRLPGRPIPDDAVTLPPVSLPEPKAGVRELPTGGERAAERRLRAFLDGPVARYHVDRDRPDVDGTSRLSPYLRFGTISARRCFTEALALAEAEPRAAEGVGKWLDELVWREFYDAVLHDAPRVLTRSYRPEYDALEWDDDPAHFEAWCEGRTGYPFVDAAMRQLTATGWMHNRARMVVASFLTKDLLIDWRKGERFFFDVLVDGDPASNNGGWQWAASTGTDAQPYFRIFNPVNQGERWDPEGRYVRRWVPELADVADRFLQSPWRADAPPAGYPAPIVDHARQRERALALYREAREQGGR